MCVCVCVCVCVCLLFFAFAFFVCVCVCACVFTCVLIQERQQRGRLLKRVSFVLVSGEANQYSSYLPEITGMLLIISVT